LGSYLFATTSYIIPSYPRLVEEATFREFLSFFTSSHLPVASRTTLLPSPTTSPIIMLGHLATAAALAVAASAQIENYQEWVEHASPASSEQYTQSANGWISPEYTWLFEYPLPIPEVAVPIM